MGCVDWAPEGNHLTASKSYQSQQRSRGQAVEPGSPGKVVSGPRGCGVGMCSVLSVCPKKSPAGLKPAGRLDQLSTWNCSPEFSALQFTGVVRSVQVLNHLQGSLAGLERPSVSSFVPSLSVSTQALSVVPAASCPSSSFPGCASPQPPNGNTGGKITISSIKIDWLNLVFPSQEWQVVAGALVGRLGSYEMRDKGMHGYHNSIRFESGAFLTWTPDREDALLSLCGGACGLMGPSDLLELIRFVASLDGYSTRLDVAFDDHDRLASMDDVHAAARARNVAGFKRYDARRPMNLLTGEMEGDSAYFGRRGRDGSGVFVRVYDKKLESGGLVDAIRWEPEFSGDRVKLLFADVAACETVEQMTVVLAAAVGGCISFLRRVDSAHGHLSRMEELPWWKLIRESLGCVKYRVVRSKPKLQQTAEWLQNQVARSMAKVVAAVDVRCGMGRDFIHSIISAAADLVDLAEIRGRALAEISMAYVVEVLGSRGGGGRHHSAKLMPAAAAAVCW